ncbi:hypothetical protein SVAN01_10563 [Stagonosporopsis vannaccii]|nr:hypothetical protein SVAN01_10563 [Stagonosporopsis vannaccii]
MWTHFTSTQGLRTKSSLSRRRNKLFQLARTFKRSQKMVFILDLRAVMILVKACAAVMTAVTAVFETSKAQARSSSVGVKDCIKNQHEHATITNVDALKKAVLCRLKSTTPRSHPLLLTQHAHNSSSAQITLGACQAAFYNMVESFTCADIIRKHAIFHLDLPEDLLAGFSVDSRILPQGPHEEPPYIKPFGRANPPRSIAFAPMIPSVETVEKFQQANWECMRDGDLRKRIAFYQGRVAHGLPSLDAFADTPEAADYVTKHLYDRTYLWKGFQEAYERNPESTLEWLHYGTKSVLRTYPEQNEESNGSSRAVKEYQKLFPEDFKRFFSGSLAPLDDGEKGEVTISPESSHSALSTISPALSYPFLPPTTTSIAIHKLRISNDSGYASSNYLEVMEVVKDDAIEHIAPSRLYCSDFPGANDFNTHESFISLGDFVTKNNIAALG